MCKENASEFNGTSDYIEVGPVKCDIHDHALTPEEVKQEYDYSGYGNHGTWCGSTPRENG